MYKYTFFKERVKNIYIYIKKYTVFRTTLIRILPLPCTFFSTFNTYSWKRERNKRKKIFSCCTLICFMFRLLSGFSAKEKKKYPRKTSFIWILLCPSDNFYLRQMVRVVSRDCETIWYTYCVFSLRDLSGQIHFGLQYSHSWLNSARKNGLWFIFFFSITCIFLY